MYGVNIIKSRIKCDHNITPLVIRHVSSAQSILSIIVIKSINLFTFIQSVYKVLNVIYKTNKNHLVFYLYLKTLIINFSYSVKGTVIISSFALAKLHVHSTRNNIFCCECKALLLMETLAAASSCQSYNFFDSIL